MRRKEAAVDQQVENYLTSWLQRPDILATPTPTPDAVTSFGVGSAPAYPVWSLLPDLTDLVGPHAARNWAAAPLETKRALIKAVCSVTVMPTKPGPHFDPDSVVIRPRSEHPPMTGVEELFRPC